MGFTRPFFQRLYEKQSNADTLVESNFVLLNFVVYRDFVNKGFISGADTVFVVNKKTEVTQQMRLSDRRLNPIFRVWR